jgi:hypothetical protein
MTVTGRPHGFGAAVGFSPAPGFMPIRLLLGRL